LSLLPSRQRAWDTVAAGLGKLDAPGGVLASWVALPGFRGPSGD
jgi:hypothetical protein